MCEYYIVSAVTRQSGEIQPMTLLRTTPEGRRRKFCVGSGCLLSLSYNGEGGIDLSISLLGVERLTNLYNRKTILSVSQVHGFLPRGCLGEKENTYGTS